MEESGQALNHWNVITSIKYEELTYNGVQWQIDHNHPIWVRLQNGGGFVASHANVIRGYDTSTDFVLYIDPGDGDYHGQVYSSYCDGIHSDGNYYEWNGSIFDCD
ncbi:MAG: C39 family peptidase [Clostridiales bacterium]|nr:C39 family peptidase [Clostridiales bacterium]MCF8022006.1 C39 family peptidase [Clostridiales bacterium]